MSHENGTRERVLDAAERLFSERGIDATSLRALTREAGVNLAAVHYHFGCKDSLLDAVVERRAKPINQQRMAELACARERAGATGPSVEAILTAFLMPGVRSFEAFGTARAQFSRLVARIEAQPPEKLESLWRRHFGEVGRIFLEALQFALPELPARLVADRFRFSLGTLSHLFSGNFDLDIIPGHPAQPEGDVSRAASAIEFLTAGLQAPPSTASSGYIAPQEIRP
jgi:AcrR family transcriptional regulator